MGTATGHIPRLIVLLALAVASSKVAGLPQTALVEFAAPAPTPETVADAADFPFLSRIAGTSLLKTTRISEPLEVKPASADSEAMLAGMSYLEKSYTVPFNLTEPGFIAIYREALLLKGWRILDQPVPTITESEPHVVTLSAHYAANGRDLYARMSRAPDGAYAISVADVGAEDWGTMLDRACHIPIASLHFKRDLTLYYEDSRPTLEKLAALIRSRPGAPIEIQGHMDNVGDDNELVGASTKRASVVNVALVTLGVPRERMTIKGYGKSRPIAANDTDWGRTRNRRIEIAAIGCKAPTVPRTPKPPVA